MLLVDLGYGPLRLHNVCGRRGSNSNGDVAFAV